MSDMEQHVGKLRKVQRNSGQSIEDWCREKCQDLGVPSMLPELYDSWQETLKYHLDFYETYFFVNGEIWEAFDHTELDADSDLYQLTPNEDETLSFTMRFYNGGTNLSECIEAELKKLKNKI
jgi:hypothetical protein